MLREINASNQTARVATTLDKSALTHRNMPPPAQPMSEMNASREGTTIQRETGINPAQGNLRIDLLA